MEVDLPKIIINVQYEHFLRYHGGYSSQLVQSSVNAREYIRIGEMY